MNNEQRVRWNAAVDTAVGGMMMRYSQDDWTGLVNHWHMRVVQLAMFLVVTKRDQPQLIDLVWC